MDSHGTYFNFFNEEEPRVQHETNRQIEIERNFSLLPVGNKAGKLEIESFVKNDGLLFEPCIGGEEFFQERL